MAATSAAMTHGAATSAAMTQRDATSAAMTQRDATSAAMTQRDAASAATTHGAATNAAMTQRDATNAATTHGGRDKGGHDTWGRGHDTGGRSHDTWSGGHDINEPASMLAGIEAGLRQPSVRNEIQMPIPPAIVTVPSCSNATAAHAGAVIVSGSYGGKYNAFNAAKWGIRGVIMNDAGVGADNAGVAGLPYLDAIGLPAATAAASSCHIGDGAHTLAHGIISHVNGAAAALGCAPDQTVRACASLMQTGEIASTAPPPITKGHRFVLRDVAGEPRLICADSVGMLRPEDAGQIVVTASHAALPGGRADSIVPIGIRAVFFSDAGVGLDGAGIARIPHLDGLDIIAGTTSADSAPIGDARALYERGVLSHLTGAAVRAGGAVGMPLKLFIDHLLAAARAR